jgi:hypothetical protein
MNLQRIQIQLNKTSNLLLYFYLFYEQTILSNNSYLNINYKKIQETKKVKNSHFECILKRLGKKMH